MALALFGVTPTNVIATRLATIQGASASDTRLNDAIDEAAEVVGDLLLQWGIEPDSVTQALYPYDYGKLKRTIQICAAAIWLQNTTGSTQAGEDLRVMFEARMGAIRDNPGSLQCYSAQLGANTANSHTTDQTPNQIATAKARFPDPSYNPIGYQTL